MSRYVSFLIQSWQDRSNGTMRWRVCRVQDEEPISLPDASFVVRTWIDDDQMIRGLIRHVQSGHEMQFQSGERTQRLFQMGALVGAYAYVYRHRTLRGIVAHDAGTPRCFRRCWRHARRYSSQKPVDHARCMIMAEMPASGPWGLRSLTAIQAP